MARAKCPNCGKFISEKATFCVYCSFVIKNLEESDENTQEKSVKITEEINEISQKEEKNSLTREMKREETLSSYNEEYVEEGYQEEFEEEHMENNLPLQQAEPEIKDEDEETISVNENELEQMNKLLKYRKNNTEEKMSSEENSDKEEKSSFPKEILLNHANGIKDKIFKKSNLQQEQEKISPSMKESDTESCQFNQRNEEFTTQELSKNMTTEYDANYDNYYDNVIAYVDARIEHLSKDHIIKTIGLVTSCILIIGFFIYFLI